jgi:hypothetical protein
VPASLASFWHDALAAQAVPPQVLVLATAAVALIAVLIRAVWRLTRNVITIAHEGGHAVAAVLAGRKVQSIRLHSDTSGLTVSKGRPTGLGMVVTLVAGYLSPALLGLGGAALLAANRITITLWASLVLLLAVLLMVRNIFGVLTVLITGGAVVAVSWYGSSTVQAGFAYVGVWFLLFGSVRPVFEVARERRKRGAVPSDVQQLAVLTHVPAFLWLTFFMLVTVGALVASLLVLGVVPRHS